MVKSTESGAHQPEFISCHLEVLGLWINYPPSQFLSDLIYNRGIIWHLLQRAVGRIK